MRRPVVVGVLLLAGALLPFDAVTNQLSNRLAGPSLAHPLGTDHLGRDVLARLAVGTRSSVWGWRPVFWAAGWCRRCSVSSTS